MVKKNSSNRDPFCTFEFTAHRFFFSFIPINKGAMSFIFLPGKKRGDNKGIFSQYPILQYLNL
jgi:hypothetical protein